MKGDGSDTEIGHLTNSQKNLICISNIKLRILNIIRSKSRGYISHKMCSIAKFVAQLHKMIPNVRRDQKFQILRVCKMVVTCFCSYPYDSSNY